MTRYLNTGQRSPVNLIHNGRDLSCSCPLEHLPCHRDVLLDVANPPANPFSDGGRAMALTLRRPWASLMLIPAELGGKTVENRSWATDYRGPVMLYAGTRVDAAGITAATAASGVGAVFALNDGPEV